MHALKDEEKFVLGFEISDNTNIRKLLAEFRDKEAKRFNAVENDKRRTRTRNYGRYVCRITKEKAHSRNMHL